VPLEPFLALQTAKVVSFTLVSDFELSRAFIQHHAANWVSKHFLYSYLSKENGVSAYYG
jgi:hypothetical protein